MSRIARRFQALREEGRAALIPFITAGDPAPEQTLPLMQALVAAGADLIELGVPFSDPMADGPVIQRASERALAHGMNLRRVLDIVRAFRESDTQTPVVLMGYLNPIEVMGYEAFAAAAAAAGVDGAITVDLPPEESAGFVAALRAQGIEPVFLIAPTSTEQRIGAICAVAGGFVYYVSLKGVTGAATLDAASVAEALGRIRAQTALPVGVGFGIGDPDAAARIGAIADAVIVGSALVRRIEEHGADPERLLAEAGALIGAMRAALPARALPA